MSCTRLVAVEIMKLLWKSDSIESILEDKLKHGMGLVHQCEELQNWFYTQPAFTIELARLAQLVYELSLDRQHRAVTTIATAFDPLAIVLWQLGLVVAIQH